MRLTIATAISLAVLLGSCTSGSAIDVTESPTSVMANVTAPPTTEVTLPPAEEVVRGTVDGVIDGETLQAVVNNEHVKIRLIGVNAPDAEDCYGAQARAALTTLVNGKTVIIAGDEPDVDAAGNALRYVIIESTPPVLVNAELVSDGAAIPLHGAHTREADLLARGDRAYASGKGIWGTYVCGHTQDGFTPDRPQLRIDDINVASDEEGEFDLADESLRIVNESYARVDIGGWVVRNETDDRYFDIPSGKVIGPGGSLQIVTGCGDDSGDVLHWCSETPVWSAAGNTVILYDGVGNVVDRRPFTIKPFTIK